MSVTLNPGDFVRVKLIKNVPGKETQPLILGWNSREFVCYPGEETVAQLEAVINAFGDPRALAGPQNIAIGDPRVSDEKLFIPDRSSEVTRLRQRYAIQTGYDTGFTDFDGNSLVPEVELHTLSGEEIIPLTSDPLGTHNTPVVVTQAQAANTDEIISRMQAQIDALRDQIAVNPKSLNELPEDSDPTDVEGIEPKTDPGEEGTISEPNPFDKEQAEQLEAENEDDDSSLPDDFTTELPSDED